MKRIVISNRSGNTGKSTLAKHWLKPRMGAGTFCVAVEGRNTTLKAYADQTIRHTGSSLYDTLEPILIRCRADEIPLLIDVGSSCEKRVSDFLSPVHNFVDLFVVPAMPDVKQIGDTREHVAYLLDEGVAPERIVVVPNNVNLDPTYDAEKFAPIVMDSIDRGFTVLDFPIFSDNLFARLFDRKETVGDIARRSFLSEPGKPAMTVQDHQERSYAIEIETSLDMAYSRLHQLVVA